MAGSDETQIRELIARWTAAVEAEDIESILAEHSPDIVMFDVPPPFQVRGLDAYRQSWEDMFTWFRGTGTFEVSDLVVTAGEDVAFCYGRLRCHGSVTLDEADLLIRLTIGLRKIDGSWVVTHEHHSEPAAPAGSDS